LKAGEGAIRTFLLFLQGVKAPPQVQEFQF